MRRQSLNLSQWTDAIGALSLHDVDLGLARIQKVWQRMTPPGGRVISIAGTNGKGTCAHFLAQALQAQGLRTGLYTSPHLLRFNERVVIDGRSVDDATLCAAFETVDALRGDVPLTFFEFTTLAALACFADADVDVLILEVGLGGRLDAVNVVDADVAIVTRIGIDHVGYLGDTRAQIAVEKAGIFRAQRPAIVGDPEPPLTLAATAVERDAVLYQRGDAFECAARDEVFDWQFGEQTLRDLPRPNGAPVASFGAGLMALALLDAMPAPQTLHAILTDWQLAGRLQFVAGQPNVLLDVAHNPQAAAVLARRLAALPGRCRVIVGMLEDKDAAGFAAALGEHVSHWHAVSVDGPRGRSAADLAACLCQAGVPDVDQSASVAGALALERARSDPQDTLVVCGSFHIVGPALAWLGLYSRTQRVAS